MDSAALVLVQRYRELVRAREADAALELVHPDFEFVSQWGTSGRKELEQFLAEGNPEYEHLTLERRDAGAHELPDGRYLTETEEVYRWKETGEIANIERRAALWTVAQGKIRRMSFFVKPAEAWAEAGVERP